MGGVATVVDAAGIDERRRERQARRAQRGERAIFGVPSRFMIPRLVFVAAVFALTAFGLLMIFSSSSITALTASDMDNNPAYYLQRQLVYVGVGIALAALEMIPDYRVLAGRFLPAFWALTVLMLLVVFSPAAGADAYGATRWIAIGPFSLQPSEFAKITIILTGADVMGELLGSGSPNWRRILFRGGIGVVLPAVLILSQPDKGTVLVISATLVVMAYFAGAPLKVYGLLAGVAVVALLAVILIDDYARQRVITMFNPWTDPDGAGYQIIQGFYAFGTGGLFGLGIGMSKQKYAYLPMAYNDFIYAVIGEELGLVGTVGMLCAFIALLWAGLQIARHAPDLTGQLIAIGCSSLLVLQMLLNVGGVLALLPLSGKPIPFISYGGSSVISSLLLAALVLSVSLRSELPDTAYDERRRDFSLTDSENALGASGVGEPVRRGKRIQGTVSESSARRGSFTVYGGGRTARGDSLDGSGAFAPRQGGRPRERGNRITTDSRGRSRIDLGPSAGERLRRNTGPDVRGVDGGSRAGRRGDRRGR